MTFVIHLLSRLLMSYQLKCSNVSPQQLVCLLSSYKIFHKTFIRIDHRLCRINSNLSTYQLHATDEGQGAPATTAPHDVLLRLCRGPRGAGNPKISQAPHQGPSVWPERPKRSTGRPASQNQSPSSHGAQNNRRRLVYSDGWGSVVVPYFQDTGSNRVHMKHPQY